MDFSSKEFQQAKKAVLAAGQAVIDIYQRESKELHITDKADRSPVTEADFKSEEIILNFLRPFNYGLLSEETDEENKRLSQEYVWIIDPLDGTKDFINQTGDFSIMIGLVWQGEAVLGLVYQPVQNRLYYGIKGRGAFLEEGRHKRRLQVSDVQDFSRARLLVSRFHLREMEKHLKDKVQIGELVACGSAGLKIGHIAAGEAEIYVNSSNKTGEWDICAADIILQEAGGKITDIEGQKIIYNKPTPYNPRGFVATNGYLHSRVIDSLRQFAYLLK
ncbi:3'(2'),5'-bisphosphate nucleotidase CysQ [Candidatus Parcubacteria bacterium]|nr:MAG: 3'(2'),5'-bisphosphate nucleotidase CysQ [Candidatus Parcubacteria bacterium]